MRRVWEDLIKNSENIFKRLVEAFSHVQFAKVFGKEGAEVRDYLRRLIANIRIEMRNTRLEVVHVE